MQEGLLVIDKPTGYTSRDIVNMVGRFLNTKKVGHAGTLDPIATGVLVVAVGSGLKILEFLTNETKEYIATVKFGITTDTLDITGNIVKENYNYFLNPGKLEEVLQSFQGKYEQEVPLYSSVRVNGKRLYQYAREKKEVTLPKREVEIFTVELISYSHEGFTFKATVSKGTYIRSLIRDIGEKLGILCTMESLRRTRQGSFSLEQKTTLEDIENNHFSFLPLSFVFQDMPVAVVDEYLEKKIQNGSLLENRYQQNTVVFQNQKGEVLAIYEPYDKDITKIKPNKVIKKRTNE